MVSLARIKAYLNTSYRISLSLGLELIRLILVSSFDSLQITIQASLALTAVQMWVVMASLVATHLVETQWEEAIMATK
jgi:hypothetical protein